MRTLAAVPPGSRVLHVECGDGRLTEMLFQLGLDVLASDKAEHHVASARRRLVQAGIEDNIETRVRRAKPRQLPFSESSFDWVILFRALDISRHFVEEAVAIFTEARRMLMPGGWLYVALDVPPDEKMKSDELALALYSLVGEARLELAESAAAVKSGDSALMHAIFRKVDPETPL
ncbi:MAG: class I SAM-dependent methyltransferase [Bacteroidota bacterium]